MDVPSRQKACPRRGLLRDTRGAISVEYITLVVVGLVIATAYASLGVALASASLRADAVLRSDSP